MIINGVRARIPAPKLPRSRTDPVASAEFINRAFKQIKGRFKGIEFEVISLFNSLPVSQQSNNAVSVDEFNWIYDVDAARLAMTNERLMEIMDKWLLDGYQLNILWSGQIVEDAYARGTALAQSNLAAMSAAYATERSLSAILMTPSYRRRVGIAYARTYEDWKGLSDKARADLAGIISESVAAGRNPKTVVKTISERLGVSRSHAENIAQTEITGALRQARWDEADETKQQLQLETVIFWTSALLPTTRRTHAARHGGTFSTDNVRQFYSVDGNRYRCHCGNTEAILIKGKPEMPKNVIEGYAKELEQWKGKADEKI